MHTARENHTATLLANGTMLVAGGQGATNAAVASAELYDPETGIWSATGSMHTARQNHTATLLESEQVLVAGGEDSVAGNPLASAELYDAATGSWSATASMNTARVFHTATLLSNNGGKVLVAGGFEGANAFALASTEVYRPGSGTWIAAPSLNTGRNSHTATFLHVSGQVLVAGGVGGVLTSFTALASAELFSAPTALELAPPLVADSTGVGPGKALANKATAIQAAVNAGQTAHVCTRIKDYLALVKAHTGKKLSTDQATQLTTAATDLADELDC
jgi:Galactose oxidase, central domain/Kelch motif